MPQTLNWQALIQSGMQFTEMGRAQARQIAAELVAQGQLAREQLAAAVDELVEMSRARSEALRELVRSEVQRQLGVLGLATQDDLVRLERKLTRAAGAPTAATRKAPAKRAPAKKAAKKAPAKAKKSGGAS